MEPYGNLSHLESHFNGGDWSPRISFSHSFACIQRVPSPTKKSPLHDSEFEFSRSVGTDLLSADELFCNGKLRPLKLSSHETDKRECKASHRRDEVHKMESSSIKKGAHAARDANSPASKEDPISVCKEDPVSRREQNGDRHREIESNAGEAKSPASREAPVYVCRRTEKVEIGKKAVDLRSPTIREEYLSSVCRREEKLEKDGPKAGKSGSPTSGIKEVISVRKLEMGENAGKSRSPTRRKELIPACKLEISSKGGKLASPISREDVMSACKKVKDLEMEGKAGEIKVLASCREDSLSTCRGTRKWEKGGIPVTWREELVLAKRNEEDEPANRHLRRFSKNPRSASMIVEGSCKLSNRSCVSLNNSRCQSPSRSFSLPSTTPASPSACSSISGFSSSSFSSSSSKYRSKIKDFFKLKKLTVPKEDTLSPAESSTFSTCRLPLSPRSLFAFFKSKESSNAGSKSASSMPKVPQQHVYNSSINNISCLTLPNSANPPPNPSFPLHFPPSSSTSKAAGSTIDKTTPQHSAIGAIGSKVRTQRSHSFSHEKVVGKEGPTMLVIDEGLWEEANINRSNNGLYLQTNAASKQGTQRIKKLDRGNMVGSKGSGPARPKGLERPLPYTSSVRVTPVLNVPSCITPSLRKTKSSTKPKAFSFENLFALRREKAFDNTHF